MSAWCIFSERHIWDSIRAFDWAFVNPRSCNLCNWIFFSLIRQTVISKKFCRPFSKSRGISTTTIVLFDISTRDLQACRTRGCNSSSNQILSGTLLKIISAIFGLSIWLFMNTSRPHLSPIDCFTESLFSKISEVILSVEIPSHPSSLKIFKAEDFPQAIPPDSPTTSFFDLLII